MYHREKRGKRDREDAHQEWQDGRSDMKGLCTCQMQSRGLGHEGPVGDRWKDETGNENEVFLGGLERRIADNRCETLYLCS